MKQMSKGIACLAAGLGLMLAAAPAAALGGYGYDHGAGHAGRSAPVQSGVVRPAAPSRGAGYGIGRSYGMAGAGRASGTMGQGYRRSGFARGYASAPGRIGPAVYDVRGYGRGGLAPADHVRYAYGTRVRRDGYRQAPRYGYGYGVGAAPFGYAPGSYGSADSGYGDIGYATAGSYQPAYGYGSDAPGFGYGAGYGGFGFASGNAGGCSCQ